MFWIKDLWPKDLSLVLTTTFRPPKIGSMKNSASILLIFFSNLAMAANPTLNAEFDRLIRSKGLNPDQFSYFAGKNETEVLADRRSAQSMIPASVTKLATAAAFLHHYQPGTKLKTQLWGSLPVDGRLQGNLILKGGGDPAFVSETLWVLVNNFTRTGIKVIEGDILVDDSLFDQERFDSSRLKDRVDRAYDAPTGAMSFNWNSVNIVFRPGKKAGETGQVFLDPENSYTKLSGKIITTLNKKVAVSAERLDAGEGDAIKVSGQLGLENAEHIIFKNITKPDLWAGHNLKAFLSQRGIEVKGKVKSSLTPGNAILLAEVESKPIEQMVADMNKFSNNYVAEMLTKHLGLIKQKPGSIANGMDVIREFLSKTVKIKSSDFLLTNPSGLTRDNRMSAKGLWQLLQHMRDQFKMMPEFFSSLPIAGVDGTLKKRMIGTAAERFVRAKTGLLNGVVSLAGYAGSKDGNIIPFVMFYNGNADESVVRQTMDQMSIQLVGSE